MNVVTRFAPSPTGYLHIGGARTAIFNWLYARHHNGKFLLRIEDTDRQRSTDDAVKAIFDGLSWLGIDYDDTCIRQSDRLSRHSDVVNQLLNSGNAYKCWTTATELDKFREEARTAGQPIRYYSEWRDRDPKDGPTDRNPVIRFRSPRTGSTIIEDLVQGTVNVSNQQLDDMILLRSDGTPTYTLSVVVDDHDMGVSHAIRGDDHLTNAARQTQLFNALDWMVPFYAHIPLIHGADGSKLSKRHGALAVSHYADLGFLPDAMFNYLIRLGWSHGNDEIISRDQAISWFNLDSVGRGPAKFDTQKLLNVNANYIRKKEDDNLFELILPYLHRTITPAIVEKNSDRLRLLLPSLKSRANNLAEMAENAIFLFHQRPLILDDKAKLVIDDDAQNLIVEISLELEKIENWDQKNLELLIRDFTSTKKKKMGEIAQPLRAALTGKITSPGIFDVLYSLGKVETLARLKDQTY